MGVASIRSTSGAFLICAVALVLAGSPKQADASGCWTDYLINQKDDPVAFVESLSEVVFIGTATARFSKTFQTIEDPEATWTLSEQTLFKVEKVIKGKLQLAQEIAVEGKSADCSCIGNFSMGEKYLVYAIDDDDTGKIILAFCNFGKRME